MLDGFGDATAALATLRREEIGRRATIETPFGRRRLCYADQTASGRFLHFVEHWINRLRPWYANSHTVISTTGALMTDLREQARALVRRGVGAGPDDVVMFVGAGATAAANKLVGLLGLDDAALVGARRPLVVVGPYEHHSNVLPWLEAHVDVVETPERPDGRIDLEALERILVAAKQQGREVLGSFSAASNVTGILTDVAAVARLLHRNNALACFDYAACAPYVPIDMHPADAEAAVDALFLSTHKFPGGPSGSGVLVASRRCFRRQVPERPGGGTVSYVSHFGCYHVDYVERLDEREEGGTPAILADVRAGIAFLVKESVGAAHLVRHETDVAARALTRLDRHPRIAFLGSTTASRLPILSFNIDGLHHDFVATLLDHLFGIQNRAGCACAGPYGHRLLGVDEARSTAVRAWVRRGVLGIKPGWVRVTLPSYASDEDVEFILSAIEFVADHGASFLPAYRLDWHDGAWRHRGFRPPEPDFALTLESLLSGGRAPDVEFVDEQALAAERARYFDEARRHAASLAAEAASARPNPSTGDADLDRLVWFRYLHATALPSGLPAPLASD